MKTTNIVKGIHHQVTMESYVKQGFFLLFILPKSDRQVFCIILPIDNFVLRVFPLLKFYVHEFFFLNLLLKTVYCQEHPSGQTEQEHFPLVLIFLLQRKLKDLIFPSF